MTTSIMAAQTVRMPRGSAIAATHGLEKAEDGTGHRHGTIASLSAFVLALTASLLVTAAMWAAR